MDEDVTSPSPAAPGLGAEDTVNSHTFRFSTEMWCDGPSTDCLYLTSPGPHVVVLTLARIGRACDRCARIDESYSCSGAKQSVVVEALKKELPSLASEVGTVGVSVATFGDDEHDYLLSCASLFNAILDLAPNKPLRVHVYRIGTKSDLGRAVEQFKAVGEQQTVLHQYEFEPTTCDFISRQIRLALDVDPEVGGKLTGQPARVLSRMLEPLTAIGQLHRSSLVNRKYVYAGEGFMVGVLREDPVVLAKWMVLCEADKAAQACSSYSFLSHFPTSPQFFLFL